MQRLSTSWSPERLLQDNAIVRTVHNFNKRSKFCTHIMGTHLRSNWWGGLPAPNCLPKKKSKVTITRRKEVDLKDSKHKCSSSSHDWKWHCTDEKKLIDEIIIPNIPSQYLRDFRQHHEEANYLRDLGKKLTDIIPGDEDVNRRDKRRENSNKDGINNQEKIDKEDNSSKLLFKDDIQKLMWTSQRSWVGWL